MKFIRFKEYYGMPGGLSVSFFAPTIPVLCCVLNGLALIHVLLFRPLFSNFDTKIPFHSRTCSIFLRLN